VFRKARYTTAIEHAIRVMVFNRLCDPESKLGVLRWLETVSIPEVDTASLTHCGCAPFGLMCAVKQTAGTCCGRLSVMKLAACLTSHSEPRT